MGVWGSGVLRELGLGSRAFSLRVRARFCNLRPYIKRQVLQKGILQGLPDLCGLQWAGASLRASDTG